MIFTNKEKKKKDEFSKIYKKFSQEIYRFSMFKLRNKENSEDVTAETFIKLYNQDFSKIKEKRAWLFKTCRNVIYDKFYRPSLNNLLDMSTKKSVINDSIVGEENIEDQILNQYTIELINSYLDKLKNRVTAEIIILKIWEQLKFTEIASITGLTENTVKQRYYRGLDELKKSLDTDNNIKKNVHKITLPLLITGIAKIGLDTQFGLNASSALSISNSVSSAIGTGINLATVGSFAGISAVTNSGVSGVLTSGVPNVLNNTVGVTTSSTSTTLSGVLTNSANILQTPSTQLLVATVGTTAIVGGSVGTVGIINNVINDEPKNETQIVVPTNLPNEIVYSEESTKPIEKSLVTEDKLFKDQISNINNISITTGCKKTYSNKDIFLNYSFEYNGCIWSVEETNEEVATLEEKDNNLELLKEIDSNDKFVEDVKDINNTIKPENLDVSVSLDSKNLKTTKTRFIDKSKNVFIDITKIKNISSEDIYCGDDRLDKVDTIYETKLENNITRLGIFKEEGFLFGCIIKVPYFEMNMKLDNSKNKYEFIVGNIENNREEVYMILNGVRNMFYTNLVEPVLEIKEEPKAEYKDLLLTSCNLDTSYIFREYSSKYSLNIINSSYKKSTLFPFSYEIELIELEDKKNEISNIKEEEDTVEKSEPKDSELNGGDLLDKKTGVDDNSNKGALSKNRYFKISCDKNSQYVFNEI